MAFLVLVLVFSLFLNVVFAEMRITVEELIEKCTDLKKTIICDPNGILNHAANDIKHQIKTMSTTSKCNSKQNECQSRNIGCLMYIVVNEGMETNYKHNHLLEEAKRFATELMEKLVSSKCGNSFLLYYSYQDHVFYVVTEHAVKRKLQSERIGEIALLNKKKLSSNLTDGILSLIKDFRLVFKNKYVSELHFSLPKYQAAQLMGGARKTVPFLPFLITILNVLGRKSWDVSHFPATS